MGPTKLPSGKPSTLTPRPSRAILPPCFSHEAMRLSMRSFAAGVMTGPLQVRDMSALDHSKEGKHSLHIDVGVEAVADFEALGALDKLGQPVLGLADGDDCEE